MWCSARYNNVLVSIMYADDTKLFYTQNNIQDLLLTRNKELKNFAKWFDANKLSHST